MDAIDIPLLLYRAGHYEQHPPVYVIKIWYYFLTNYFFLISQRVLKDRKKTNYKCIETIDK